jgi:chemotaxis response regulator CheB
MRPPSRTRECTLPSIREREQCPARPAIADWKLLLTRAPRVRASAKRVQPSAPGAPVVAIGGSVGALPAFTELLAHVPGDTGMAFVFLQHLDPRRDSLLVELLRAPSRMPVREVEDEMSLEPNEVYVVPSAHDAAYLDGCFKLGPRRVPAAPSVLIDGFMSASFSREMAGTASKD